ncbi:AEC family transporter [Vibrio sp. E150_011]
MNIVWMLPLILFGFIVGNVIQRVAVFPHRQLSLFFTRTSLYTLLPFSVLCSLWQLPRINPELLSLPLIGFAVIVSGIAVGFISQRVFDLKPKQFGALLPVSSFYNLGALGSLIVFILYGENAVAYLALFKLTEELIYFGWVFPFSRSTSVSLDTVDTGQRSRFKDPVFLLALAAVFLGLLLNAFSIPRPDFVASIIAVTVPLSSLLMITAVGMTFCLKGGREWVRLAVFSSLLRIVFALCVVVGLLSVMGLWSFDYGLLASVCLLLALMPTGFMSTLPSVLYNLDNTLASTCWLMSFIIALVVLPLALVFL